jgi:hypothetical protein
VKFRLKGLIFHCGKEFYLSLPLVMLLPPWHSLQPHPFQCSCSAGALCSLLEILGWKVRQPGSESQPWLHRLWLLQNYTVALMLFLSPQERKITIHPGACCRDWSGYTSQHVWHVAWTWTLTAITHPERYITGSELPQTPGLMSREVVLQEKWRRY